MKSALTLPIVSGIALAIMAGAAASHYQSVDNMVAFAGMTRANGMPSLSTGPARLVSNERDAREGNCRRDDNGGHDRQPYAHTSVPLCPRTRGPPDVG